MSEKKWTVGQPCIVTSHKSRYDAVVTKVGRKYVTVSHPIGALSSGAEIGQFHLDGRNTTGYSNPHLWTVEAWDESERRSKLTARLRDWGISIDHGSRTLTTDQIAALVAALPGEEDQS